MQKENNLNHKKTKSFSTENKFNQVNHILQNTKWLNTFMMVAPVIPSVIYLKCLNTLFNQCT